MCSGLGTLLTRQKCEYLKYYKKNIFFNATLILFVKILVKQRVPLATIAIYTIVFLHLTFVFNIIAQ